MSKNQIRTAIVIGVIFVMYNVLVFAIPFKMNGVFWVSYIFSAIAILLQFYTAYEAFAKGKNAKSKFYGFPIVQIGVVYLAVQLGFGFLFMALAKWSPVWIAAAVCIIVFGVAVVGFVGSDAMCEEIERQDVKIKRDVSLMRRLQSEINFLVGQCEDGAVKTVVQNLAERLKYSDPVSSAELAEVETDLSECIAELQKAVTDGDNDSARELCKRADTVLARRNHLCRLSK